MTLIKIKFIRLGDVETFLISVPSTGPWTLERLCSVEARMTIGRLLERHGYSKRVLRPVGITLAPQTEFADWEITFHEYPHRGSQGASGVYRKYQCMGWDIQFQNRVSETDGFTVSSQCYYGSV